MEVMRSLGKKRGGAGVSEEPGTGGEGRRGRREARGNWWRSRSNGGERRAGGEKGNRRLRKLNSKFKWHLSGPWIRSIFTNVV